MASCPQCHRPVAMLRTSCLYCGAVLPAEAVAAAARTAAESRSRDAPRGPDRQLLILDLGQAAAERAAGALGVLPFEVQQWARRSRFHLLCVLPEAESRARADALRQAGMDVFLLREAALKNAVPVRALGGVRAARGLDLRCAQGPQRLGGGDLLLLVQGPITREYQVPAELALIRNLNRLKRFRSATLTQGFRYHLHLKNQLEPVELDPSGFAFGGDPSHPGSSEERLASWMAEITTGIPVDDCFRRQTPALAPAEPEPGPLAAAEALGRRSLEPQAQASQVLDNLAQFRFYSAWRGLLERQRAGLTAAPDPVLPSGPDS